MECQPQVRAYGQLLPSDDSSFDSLCCKRKGNVMPKLDGMNFSNGIFWPSENLEFPASHEQNAVELELSMFLIQYYCKSANYFLLYCMAALHDAEVII